MRLAPVAMPDAPSLRPSPAHRASAIPRGDQRSNRDLSVESVTVTIGSRVSRIRLACACMRERAQTDRPLDP